MRRMGWAVLSGVLVVACGDPSTTTDGGDSGSGDGGQCSGAASCNDGLFCNGEEQCTPGDPEADARGCVAGTAPCTAGETCDERGQTCQGDCGSNADADGDGEDSMACGGEDCDDTDAGRYPGNTEVCDAADVDEDCDPSTFGARDSDGDGYDDAACCNGTSCGPDCDDSRSTAHPTAPESCDDVDQDCDTLIDEGVVALIYPDGDGDGFGTGAGVMECPTAGYSLAGGDCDDADPARSPGLTELCGNGIDDDCDGGTDESGPRVFFRDRDGDGYGDGTDTVMLTACDPPSGYSTSSSDCNDMDIAVHPGAPELCNGADDNCTPGGAEDGDGDGHAPTGTLVCSGGPFPADDCNDSIATMYTGAVEQCDGLDTDCSSGGGALLAEDADGDTHSPLGAACVLGFERNDCDDTRATVYTGAVEICDGFDSDCNGGGGPLPAEDMDGDMHAPSGTLVCNGGPFPRDDCDDARPSVYMGAPELCDRLDTDCSSGGGAVTAEDADGDTHTATSYSMCSGGFARDDCNDNDPALYPGAAPAPPALLGPMNGAMTGSFRAAARGTLRPTFRWRTVSSCSTVSYDIQVDDTCSIPFASCAFPSPTHSATGLATTSSQPASDLAVSTTVAPMGRRYYWRVRACVGALCGAWSMVRYVDVGRVPSDVNGDGYGDLIVGADQQDNGVSNEGNVFVYLGTATVPAAPVTLDNPTNQANAHFGASIATAGDLNGDGYGDILVGADDQDAGAVDEGNAFVYLGSSTGLPTLPSVTLDSPANQASGSHGYSVAGAGDINGDGYADLVVGAPYQDAGAMDEGSAFVYLGQSSGVPLTPSFTLDNPANQVNGNFGWSVALAGDVNGDGYTDVVVGAFQDVGSSNEGNAFVYLGSSTGVPATPSRTLDNPAGQANGYFGGSVASAGDVNGDGYADLVVGAAFQDAGASNEGSAFVYLGSPTGVPMTPSRTLDNPANQADGAFGAAVASAGDVNGDGYADIVVGAEAQDAGATNEGNAFVYYGSSTGIPATPSRTLDNPANQMNSYFGHAAASASDGNGDGYADLVVGAYLQDGGAVDGGSAFVYRGAATGVPATPNTTLPNPRAQAGGQFGWSVGR